MIKCFWFWKLLKQLFIISLISCFGLLGSSFVNAWTVQSVWLDKYNSEYNSAFKVWFIKWGWVLTEYLWTAKSVLALNSNVLFWWAENWQPYFYAPWFQWFFWQFYTCDVLTWTDSPIANHCQATTLTDDYKGIFKSFFSKVKQWDYAWYDYYYLDTSSWNWYNRQKRIQVCFSSEEIWSSLCFRYSSCQVSSNLSFCDSRNYWSLVNSQNLSNLTFANIPRSYISYAPWQAWYDWSSNIEWWSVSVEIQPITWDTMNVSCSKSRALEWYRCNWYKTRVCYAWYWNNSSIFDWTPAYDDFQLTWLSIADVWFDTAWYRSFWNTWDWLWYNHWFSYWRNIYDVHRRKPELDNPFVWVPVSIFSLFWNVSVYWKSYDDRSILEFCDLALYTADLNTEYTWVASNVVCSMSPIELVDCQLSNFNNPDDWLPWYWNSSWTVSAIWSSWKWITDRFWTRQSFTSWDIQSWESLTFIWDWKSFENNFFNDLKAGFIYPDSNNLIWVLPRYIVMFFCAIIFFRFLGH